MATAAKQSVRIAKVIPITSGARPRLDARAIEREIRRITERANADLNEVYSRIAASVQRKISKGSPAGVQPRRT